MRFKLINLFDPIKNFYLLLGKLEKIITIIPYSQPQYELDKKLVLGGMPLSLYEYPEQITETIHTSPPINRKITVYAINIIKKYTIHPIVSTEFSTVWQGTRYAMTQDSDGKLYINIIEHAETSLPRGKTIIQGMPIAVGEHIELMFHDSGYTTHNIDRYSHTMIGGMPVTLGQIGEKWYIVAYVVSSDVS